MEVQDGYKIIVAASPTDLTGLVNAAIREGWQTKGGPFKRDGAVCQAVVKKACSSTKPAGVEFKLVEGGSNNG